MRKLLLVPDPDAPLARRRTLCATRPRRRRRRPPSSAAAQADADRRRGSGLGDALPDHVPLQADAARRCDVGADLQALPRFARQRPAVLHAGRHRPLRPSTRPSSTMRSTTRTCPRRSRSSISTSSASANASRMRARCSPRASISASDETYQYDREKAPWAKNEAELDDLWRKRIKNDWLRLKLAGKADKDIRDTLDKRYANYLDRVQPAQQRRRVPDVHERVRDVDRAAHQLPRPARVGELRHRDEAVARRHRRGAAARRGLHRDPRDRARRPGRAVRQGQGRRPHRRRRPGRSRRRSSTWSAGASTTSSRRSAARRTPSCAWKCCPPMPAPTAST